MVCGIPGTLFSGFLRYFQGSVLGLFYVLVIDLFIFLKKGNFKELLF